MRHHDDEPTLKKAKNEKDLYSEHELEFDKGKPLKEQDPVKRAAMIESRIKQREKIYAGLQKIVDSFASVCNDLERHDLETYELLFTPDALYSDSPLSPAFLHNWIRQYLFKLDVDWLSGVFFDGKPDMKTLVEHCSESSKWALRFTVPIKQEKTGLAKIVED